MLESVIASVSAAAQLVVLEPYKGDGEDEESEENAAEEAPPVELAASTWRGLGRGGLGGSGGGCRAVCGGRSWGCR